MLRRGIAIVHYDRNEQLTKLLDAVKNSMPVGTKIVVCDDGTTDPVEPHVHKDVIYIKGPNLGVAANKNRALWALQDCHYIAILEDDLFPIEKGWFEIYEDVSSLTQNHHFCRVQGKEIMGGYPNFEKFLKNHSYTPIFGSSPRGDFTFITGEVLRKVGGFNPLFRGAGYAHGEWSDRIARAKLISHPAKWWDIMEARDKFKQKGDTEGGRWKRPNQEIKNQLKGNKITIKRLQKTNYIYHPLSFE